MSLLDRLKKASKAGSIISGIALSSALAVANFSSENQEQNEPGALPKNKIMMVQDNPSFQKNFNIQGTTSEIQSVKKSLSEMYKTVEGKKLLDTLHSTGQVFQISISNSLDNETYANTNPKKEGFPIQLSQKAILNSDTLTTTLFHELCHVRQYSEGVGRISDLPEERYDNDLANEIEARLTTSIMAESLPSYHTKLKNNAITSSNWMDSAIDLDNLVYQSLKKGMKSSHISEQEIDKLIKTEMIKSALSGRNTEMISKTLPQEQAQLYETLNQSWLNAYSIQASGHAYDDFYPTMTPNSKATAELIENTAQRLNVDKQTLLSPTGADLLNIKRDNNGRITSCERKQRATNENLGNLNLTYDDSGRPLSMTEYDKNQSVKSKTEYKYASSYLPIQITETENDKTKTILFNHLGERTQETLKTQNSESTISYQNGKKTHETLKHEFGVSDTEYDTYGNRLHYTHKTNDGTIIDEYHAPNTQSSSQNVFLKHVLNSGNKR